MAERINSDASRRLVQPRNGKAFTLEELQDAVGGYIEIVGLPDGRCMVLNEEGKLHGLPYNQVATALARPRIGAADYVVGDVLVCSDQELEDGQEAEQP